MSMSWRAIGDYAYTRGVADIIAARMHAARRSLLYKSNRALQLETLMRIYWIIIALRFPSPTSISFLPVAAAVCRPFPVPPPSVRPSVRPSVGGRRRARFSWFPRMPLGSGSPRAPRLAGDAGQRPSRDRASDDRPPGALFVLRSFSLRRCFHGDGARSCRPSTFAEAPPPPAAAAAVAASNRGRWRCSAECRTATRSALAAKRDQHLSSLPSNAEQSTRRHCASSAPYARRGAVKKAS